MNTDASAVKTGEAQMFIFTGSGREYFGIWFVNFALSVLTFGVYSAWAKVRRLQYFHRHTRLAGAPFDYHGEPVAILKGRLVAVCLLAIYTLAGYAGPLAGLAAFGLIGLVLPWLLARSLLFRLHNTSYRGLRFRFSGSTAQAYWVFLGLPVLSLLTLLLLAPLCHHRIKRYQIANAAWGATPFTFRAPVAPFYKTYFASLGLLVAMALGAGIALAILNAALQIGSGSNPRPMAFTMATASLVSYAAIGLGLRAFVDARLRTVVWQRIELGSHRMVCFMEASGLFFVSATNLVATVLTLGLFLPFAQIRMARYIADAVFVVPGGSIDDVAAGEPQGVGAVGDESVGMLDFDIAM